MILLFSILLIVSGWISSSWASGIVQDGVLQPVSNTSSATYTYTSAVGAGNTLVCVVEWDGGTSQTVSDNVNAGNWTAARTQTVLGLGGIFYKLNTAAGTPTVTVTLTGGPANADIAIYEIAGTAFDAASSGESSGSSPATGTIAPTNSGDVILSLVFVNSASVTITPAAGYTANGTQQGFGSQSGMAMYIDGAISGSQNEGASWTPTSPGGISIAAAFTVSSVSCLPQRTLLGVGC